MYCSAVSCIGTSLLFPDPSAAGEMTNLFHRINDCALGDVTGHFHFANFARKDKWHHTVLGLLVVLQARENFAGTDAHFRQTTETQYSIGNSSSCHTVGTIDAEGNVSSRNHAPG